MLLLYVITGVGALGELAVQDQILFLILTALDAVAIHVAAPQLATLFNIIVLLGLGCMLIAIVVSDTQPSILVAVSFISYTESTSDVLSGIPKFG